MILAHGARAAPASATWSAAANLTIEAFFGAPRAHLRRRRAAPAGAAQRDPGARRGRRSWSAPPSTCRIEPPVDRISAEMAQHFWYVDASKAQTELGWAPRDPGETLADTVADLRARGVVWPEG